jgi:thiamine biosynthesis lipoprotein
VRVRPLLGTFVKVRGGGALRTTLESGIGRAFSQLERIHRLMSYHDPTSDVSRLNASAAFEAVTVSVETYAVLKLACQLHDESEGAFDVAVAPALVRWGFLPSASQPVGDAEDQAHGTSRDLVLLAGRRVRFARPMRIDLGGIAKGHAVDLAVAALRAAGVPRGAVDAGGDLRVFGPHAEVVHVRHPRWPGQFIPLARLRDGALATSGFYFSRRRHAGQIVSPVVNPHTGRACVRPASASVAAPTAALADALTKVVLLAGERAFPLVRRLAASATLLFSGGDVIGSEPNHAA